MPSSTKKTNYNYEKSGQNWKNNPYFQAGVARPRTKKGEWSEEHLANVRKRIIKYNKSRAGRKMASKRSKALMKDEAVKQRWMDAKELWQEQNHDKMVEHTEKYLAPHNQARHHKAQKKHAIERAREMYRMSNVKPIIKPLPNQSDEYYDALDDFFAEGF